MTRALGLLKVGASLDLNRLNRDLKKSKGSVLGTFKNIGKTIASPAFIGGAVVGVGIGIGKLVGDFEEMENTIIKATGRSGEALKSATDEVGRLATIVPGGRQAMAELFGTIDTGLASLELTDTELGSISEQVAKFARNTDTEGTVAAKNFTAAMTNWGLSADESSQFLDVLNKTQQDFNISGDKLFSALTKNGDELRSFGFTADESAVLMGRLAASGEGNIRSFTGMAGAVGSFAKREGLDAQTAFEQLTEQVANASSAQEANKIAIDALGGSQGAFFAESVRSGLFGMEDIAQIQEDAAGTVDKTADATLTLGERFGLLANKLVVKLDPIINKILRVMEDWIPVLIEVIENVSEHLGPIFQWLADEVLPPLIAFIKDTLIPAWQDIARDVFPEIEKVMKEVVFPIFKFLIENVLPPVINILKFVIPLAVGILVGAITTGFDLIKGVINAATATWDVLTNAWDWIVDRAEWLKDSVVGVFSGIADGIRLYINIWLGLIEGAINGISSGVNSVSGLISKIPGVEIPEIPRLTLPRLADGGIVRDPTIAMIGEEGPEAVVPLDGRAAGVSQTFIFNIENAYGEDITEIIRRELTAIDVRGL